MTKINFGCGLSVAVGWTNYDASPTLRAQRLPVIGELGKVLVKPRFPDSVRFGDIVRGLPEPSSTADIVYCSHVLEHLSLKDLRLALSEVLRVMRPGAIFRGVLPDLEVDTKAYLTDVSVDACSKFMRTTCLGHEQRPHGFMGRLRALIGNSHHLWMWDYKGLEDELKKAGFVEIRRAVYHDSNNPAFNAAEDLGRWEGCLGFECRKSEL